MRTALALSAITKRPIEVAKIRAGRKKPGLMAQHLTCLRAAQLISGAKVEGAQFGSSRILFEPKEVRGGQFSFDVAEERGSAGSVGLVLQTLLPMLTFGQSAATVVLKGGTHVLWAPTFHYLDRILLPTLERMGVRCKASLRKWGYYPIGGGEVLLELQPAGPVQAIQLTDRGALEKVKVLSAVSNLPISIAQRQLNRALERLKAEGLEPEPELVEGPSPGTGTFCFISVRFSNALGGFSSLGERGKPAEAVADEACDSLFFYLESGAAIEEHLADQLLVFASLARGHSSLTTSKVTHHLFTNIWVVEQLLPVKIRLDGELGQAGRVEVEGVGMSLAGEA